jgi:lipoate-protein ligase B
MDTENKKSNIKCWLLNLDTIDYDDGLELQKELEEKRKLNQIPDTIVLLEHHPVYTMGRGTDPDNLLMSRDDLEERGIKVREIRRGGDITYHGPGQIVGYPIIDLKQHKKDVHWYLRCLEQVLIDSLKEYGLQCYTISGMTGVWCEGGKIAAIGVGISRWVTSHGFALNVNTDLGYFGGIIPCGIQNKPVTSMQAQLRRTIDPNEVRSTLLKCFESIFNLAIEPADLGDI